MGLIIGLWDYSIRHGNRRRHGDSYRNCGGGVLFSFFPFLLYECRMGTHCPAWITGLYGMGGWLGSLTIKRAFVSWYDNDCVSDDNHDVYKRARKCMYMYTHVIA
ncbi:hypothetical protein DM02DRAFT_204125 [Periconia macrospinosa]|uniref:Uncharacterized protein n=1 Tax=Periconia macrospinosa TaxID=97972 RepID=A0A2V1D9C1_9PLEO|nr:hypothetical protein DM02DRAFT_204125 [Periconia macrospinosa]